MARRRMLSTQISLSEKINSVSIEAALLYTWMIPHQDELGLMEASPKVVKARIVPMRDDMNVEIVELCLEELEAIGAIKRYEADGSIYLSNPKFFDFQTFKSDREIRSEFPLPPWITIEKDSKGKHSIILDSKVFHRNHKLKGNLKGREGKVESTYDDFPSIPEKIKERLRTWQHGSNVVWTGVMIECANGTPEEWILAALEAAENADACNWNYVRATIEGIKRDGGPGKKSGRKCNLSEPHHRYAYTETQLKECGCADCLKALGKREAK